MAPDTSLRDEQLAPTKNAAHTTPDTRQSGEGFGRDTRASAATRRAASRTAATGPAATAHAVTGCAATRCATTRPAATGRDGHDPLPIQYAAEDVAARFAALLASLDFRDVMDEMGVGFFGRGKAEARLTAVCVCLWHLALERSFPQDARAFAEHFAATSPLLAHEKKKRVRALRAMVHTYDALLAEKKEADFSVLAEHVAASLAPSRHDGEERKRQLKLSLRIRALYATIFDNLIPVG